MPEKIEFPVVVFTPETKIIIDYEDGVLIIKVPDLDPQTPILLERPEGSVRVALVEGVKEVVVSGLAENVSLHVQRVDPDGGVRSRARLYFTAAEHPPKNPSKKRTKKKLPKTS